MMLHLLWLLLACDPKPVTDPGGDDDDATGDDDDVTGDDDDTTGDDDDVTGDDDDVTGDDDDVTGDDDDVTGDDDDDTTPLDGDGDGSMVGDDCDEADPGRYPGAPERCNGLDDDCDGDTPDAEDDPASCADCDAAGFWLGTLDLSGAALGDAVALLVAPQTCSDYNRAREFLFAELDNDAGTIRCVYTGKSRSNVGAGFSDWDDMNTEHTWPRSLGADVVPAECDLHHLFITDAVTNAQRGNYPFGEVQNDTDDVLHVSGGVARLGTDSSGDTVFEPPAEHKGNVARAMTYFAHRYDKALTADELALYQTWHAADPVDADEIARSVAIGAEQVLANPFVVCPDLLPRL